MAKVFPPHEGGRFAFVQNELRVGAMTSGRTFVILAVIVLPVRRCGAFCRARLRAA